MTETFSVGVSVGDDDDDDDGSCVVVVVVVVVGSLDTMVVYVFWHGVFVPSLHAHCVYTVCVMAMARTLSSRSMWLASKLLVVVVAEVVLSLLLLAAPMQVSSVLVEEDAAASS
jgi:hypothetical protein